ncbi:MAG: hypothetical protein CME59_08960 [Halioglobus sp.]|nr:hypothetical protein [Halioglobus sp.]MAT92718.1 hypothetical protein [Halioglobus sp.]|tara:strand:- start:1311 stop:1604 length:294 start_codon:yes stop_codon:yes gene_type:complete
MGNPLQLRHGTLARALALLALLAVLGGQVLETQHSHALTDPVAGCLLCQGAASAALPAADFATDLSDHNTAPRIHTTGGDVRSYTHHNTARGPPYNA